MSTGVVVLSTVGAVVAALLVAVLGGLAQDEVKGWLARIPFGLLRVARSRLPVDARDDLYEDWIADLTYALADKADRPVTRLVVGIRFAWGLLVKARSVAEELGECRVEASPAQTTGFSGTAVLRRDENGDFVGALVIGGSTVQDPKDAARGWSILELDHGPDPGPR